MICCSSAHTATHETLCVKPVFRHRCCLSRLRHPRVVFTSRHHHIPDIQLRRKILLFTSLSFDFSTAAAMAFRSIDDCKFFLLGQCSKVRSVLFFVLNAVFLCFAVCSASAGVAAQAFGHRPPQSETDLSRRKHVWATQVTNKLHCGRSMPLLLFRGIGLSSR